MKKRAEQTPKPPKPPIQNLGLLPTQRYIIKLSKLTVPTYSKKRSKEMKETNKNSISQLEIAKVIAEKTQQTIELITQIIELEQKLTMESVKKGLKVIKKNYLTLSPTKLKERTIHSKLTNLTYDLPQRQSVKVTVGEGFKSFINQNKPMKEKICRFVAKEKHLCVMHRCYIQYKSVYYTILKNNF